MAAVYRTLPLEPVDKCFLTASHCRTHWHMYLNICKAAGTCTEAMCCPLLHNFLLMSPDLYTVTLPFSHICFFPYPASIIYFTMENVNIHTSLACGHAAEQQFPSASSRSHSEAVRRSTEQSREEEQTESWGLWTCVNWKPVGDSREQREVRGGIREVGCKGGFIQQGAPPHLIQVPLETPNTPSWRKWSLQGWSLL